MTIWKFVREGGWAMYLLMLCGPAAIGFAVAHAVALRRWTFWTAVGLAIATAAVGLIGTLSGLQTSFDSVSGDDIDPTTKAKILAGGISESVNCSFFALVVVALAAVPVIVGEVRLYRRKRASAPFRS